MIEDDTGKPDVGRAAVEKLISKDKVVMLGGGYSSSETYAIAGVGQQNKIPFLINTGSADNITAKGWDYIFRLNPPVSEYAEADGVVSEGSGQAQDAPPSCMKTPSSAPPVPKSSRRPAKNCGSRSS